jgi:two-component system response regulator FlrC
VSTVLIIQPDAALREALASCIREAGWAVEAIAHPPARASARPAIVVIYVATAAGIRAIEAHVREGARVVAVGAAEPRRLAIDALRAGACEFLRKPFGLRALERALAAVDHGLRRNAARDAFEWSDARMARLRREVEAAARSDATLQIVGERGTGRHRLARFVHAMSRRGAPLVEFEPAEPSVRRLEQGGASRAAAALAAAAGGTLLIDAPAALTVGEQAELLHALSGDASRNSRPATRVIVICERPLRDEPRLIAELRFRLDVLLLALPPLRERPADVERLARDLAERAAITRGVAPPRFTNAALAALRALPLPGNEPELASLMERAAALFAGRVLDVEGLLRARSETTTTDASGTLDLGELERVAVGRALAKCRGNRTHAARELGISVRTLRNKLREYAACEARRAGG